MPSSKKAAALKRLKEERARNELGLGGNKLDEYQVEDPGDVYDVLEEDEYRKLVESRRQREDFVVDDGESCCQVVSFPSCMTHWLTFMARGILSCYYRRTGLWRRWRRTFGR